jgi:hypothetical protein
MPKPSSKPLKPNPFMAYRDPETGRWVVAQRLETGELVPPKPRMPVLRHPEAHLIPLLAEAVLAGTQR